MLKFLLSLAGVVLVAIGGNAFYHAGQSRQQTVLSCDQLVQRPPRTLWLHATGCELDYIHAGVRESGGQIEELLFPVRPAGHPPTEPAALVAATHDPAALAIAQGTIGDGRQPDQDEFLVMMLKIVTALRASRDIDGLARAGWLEEMRTRRLLSGMSAPLAARVMLIDLHAAPDFVTPSVVSAAGVVALIAALALAFRERRRKRVALTAPIAVAAPPGEVPAPSPEEAPSVAIGTSPRLRLLLLNLGADAERDAIEHAPPLGDVESVRARILGHIPELQLDDRNRGVVAGNGYTMTIDLGTHDPVPTAVIDARGAGAIAAAKQLLAGTGWRAYAPQSGEFVDAGHLDELAAAS